MSGIAYPSLRGPVATALRMAAFAPWFGAIALAWLPIAPFLGRRAKVAWAGRCTHAFNRGMMRILGIRLKVHGRPPRGPFFLVTNHLGYLDVTVLASALRCAFVAKSEVAAWPVFGAPASWSGTLFIDRKSSSDVARVNRLIADRMECGGSLVLFPEGTSTDGEGLETFRSSLLQGPAASALPVHFAALRYRTPGDAQPASRSMCWWGDMEFLPHFLNLFRMQGMEASIAFGNQPVADGNRKVLAERLREGVQDRLDYLESLERGPRARSPSQAMLRETAA